VSGELTRDAIGGRRGQMRRQTMPPAARAQAEGIDTGCVRWCSRCDRGRLSRNSGGLNIFLRVRRPARCLDAPSARSCRHHPPTPSSRDERFRVRVREEGLFDRPVAQGCAQRKLTEASHAALPLYLPIGQGVIGNGDYSSAEAPPVTVAMGLPEDGPTSSSGWKPHDPHNWIRKVCEGGGTPRVPERRGTMHRCAGDPPVA